MSRRRSGGPSREDGPTKDAELRTGARSSDRVPRSGAKRGTTAREGGKNTFFVLRLSERDRQRVQSAADEEYVTASAWVRRAVMQALERHGKK